jgi:hypothetical protein
MPQGHLSGSLEKACNHTYLNKWGSYYDKQEKDSEIKGPVSRRKRELSMA